MSNAIWNFVLDEPDAQGLPPSPRARFFVEMPRGATVLSAASGADARVTIWALVNPEAPSARRRIEVFATGDVDVAGMRFIDTVLVSLPTWKRVSVPDWKMPLVWHVFDAGEEPL